MQDPENFDWELKHALADDSDDTEIEGLGSPELDLRSPKIDSHDPFQLAAIAGLCCFLVIWSLTLL